MRGRAFSIPRLSQFRLRACTLEEVLAHGATSIGPALIIGEPGERLPRLGGSREYVPDNEWQTAVTRLMAHSSRMFFVAGDTPNLGWELRTAVAQFGLNRVVLVLPPLRDRQIEARWHRFTNEPGLPSLPEDSSGLVLVTFVDGAPVLFKTDQRRVELSGGSVVAGDTPSPGGYPDRRGDDSIPGFDIAHPRTLG